MHPPLPSLNQKPSTGKAVSALVFGILSPLILVGGFGLLLLAHFKETVSVIVLGLGVLCIFALSGVFALIAIICGHSRLSEIRNSPSTVSGRGMAISGLVLGYLMVFILTAWILLAIILPKISPQALSVTPVALEVLTV